MFSVKQSYEILGDTLADSVVENLRAKHLNDYTIAHVLDYLVCNEKAFGNILKTSTMAKHICTNLHDNIRCFDSWFKLKDYFTLLGSYIPNYGSININPKNKLMAKLVKSWDKRLTSVIRHELDHCATTCLPIEHPIITQEAINGKYRMDNNAQCDVPKKEKIKIENDIYISVKFRSGFDGCIDSFENSVPLKALNEGITRYKQAKFDMIDFGKVYASRGYTKGQYVAEHIVDVIGEELLLKCHAAGDYTTIRQAYNKATGQDLNLICWALHNNWKTDAMPHKRPKQLATAAELIEKVKNDLPLQPEN